MRITSMSHLTHVARSARRLSRPIVRNTTAIGRAALRPSAYRARTHRLNPSTLPGLPAPAARGVRLSPWLAGGAFVAATYATGAENVGELEKKHTWNRSVALGSFVKSGIKMNEELIAPTHERIAKDATRKATTDALLEAGGVVRWLDASGVVELEGHGSQKFPIALFANGDVGFDGKAILEYRVLTPVHALTSSDLTVNLESGSLILPTNPEDLADMPAGSVFEISGRGTFRAKGHLESRRGAGGVLLTAVANAGADAEAKASSHIKLKMKVLDDAGRVEVVVEESGDQKASFAAFLKTTLGLDNDAVDKLGEGELEKALIKEGRTKVNQWWKQYKDSQLRFEYAHESTHKNVGTFVIDTSNPDGALAYQALLTLDVDAAEALSAKAGSGVSARGSHAASTEDRSHLEASLGGHRILLNKALEAERSGEVTVDGERISLFRENEITHTVGNFLAGYETVKWDAVSVVAGANADTTTFYNLNYEGDDWITGDNEVERFFGFADALGVENATARKRDGSGMWWITRIFSDRDNTKVKVDMYFTQDGVKKIAESSYEEAQLSILKACAALNPRVAGIESLTVDQLEQAVDMAWDLRQLLSDNDVGYVAFSDCLAAKQYREMTGRELLGDMDTIETAYSFLNHKSGFGDDATDAERRNFFVELGREQRFRFKSAMVALATLAGRDNTMVDTLSMVGKETELVAASEGRVDRPTASAV